MEATAATHHTLEVLNPAFIPDPTDVNAVELFAAKNVFMYSVFEAKLKTAMRMSIVHNNEVLRNAQQVWQQLMHH